MDRTDRPADDRDPADEVTADDAAGGEESTDATDSTEATDGDDRSALHVASEGTNWRFSLDDLDDEGDREPEPLTPGSPELEHVAFVLLGAAFTLFVFSRFLV